MVTLLMTVLLMTVVFVVLVMLVVLLLLTTELMRMPTLTTGGAPVTTAGEVPMGAGMMMPNADPGGAGIKTPSGPIGGGPGTTPGPGTARVRLTDRPGATKDTPGAPQNPPTNTTWLPRWS